MNVLGFSKIVKLLAGLKWVNLPPHNSFFSWKCKHKRTVVQECAGWQYMTLLSTNDDGSDFFVYVNLLFPDLHGGFSEINTFHFSSDTLVTSLIKYLSFRGDVRS